MFEAHAAEVIGGYAPQVRYRTSDGRWLVIWQGDVVNFSAADDPQGHASALADHRIAMALVGLFQDDRIAQLSRAVLHAGEPAEIEAKGTPTVRQVADGFEVSDGTFRASYADYKVAERVAAWLANPDDERPLSEIVYGTAKQAAASEPTATPTS